MIDPREAARRMVDTYESWCERNLRTGTPDAIIVARALLAVPSPSEEVRGALEKIYQRCNESGTGEMGLLDTIHAVSALARAALAAASSPTSGGPSWAEGIEEAAKVCEDEGDTVLIQILAKRIRSLITQGSAAHT